MPRSFTLQAVDPFSGRPIGPPTVLRPAADPGRLAAAAAEPPPPADDPLGGEPYPEDGTKADVLAWVDHPGLPDAVRSARAKAAIVAEHGRGRPRTTLLRELTERTG